MLRLFLVELPALIVSVWMRAWLIFVAAVALLSLVFVMYAIVAAFMGWPLPLIGPAPAAAPR